MAVEVGSIVEGKITGVKKFGAFVALPGGQTGMVHISEVSNEYIQVHDHSKVSDVLPEVAKPSLRTTWTSQVSNLVPFVTLCPIEDFNDP